MRLSMLAAAAALFTPAIASATETISYGYDAKGRVVRVVRSGSVNNGVNATYQFDRADNRTRLTTTGSPNPPQP